MSRQAWIEIYPGDDGDQYIRVRAGNGEIIATGAEGYATKANAKRAAEKLVDTIVRAEVIEVPPR